MTRGDLPLEDRLERIEDKQDQMLQTQVVIQIELAALKTRASFWGATWGLIGGAVISAAITHFVGG